MVQEQLVDYISSQMKLGVSRDAIKSALVSAGWVAGDVEDTLKKAEGGMPAASAMPSMATAKPVQSASSVSAGTAGATKSPDPQMIKVSDLVSSPFSGSPAKPVSASSSNDSSTMATKFGGTIKGNSFEASPSKEKGKGMLIMGIIGGIIILGLAGLSWYFYSGNAALASQIASLNSQSASVSSQLTSLQSQFNASSSNLTAQIGTLTAANADLALNLSFYAVPIGTPTSTADTPISVTLAGSLSGGGKAPYAITTPLGTKVFVVNSTDATIDPELKPLIGQTIQVAGTYVEGSDEMTVTSISTSTPTTQ